MPGPTVMRIILESEDSIRLRSGAGGLELEAVAGVGLSPFHLLAASLGACTRSVLLAWAEAAALDIAGLEVVVDWEFGGDPVRVSEFRMVLVWPALPAARRAAAERAAAQCTVHHTLAHGSRVATRVAGSPEAGADGPPDGGRR